MSKRRGADERNKVFKHRDLPPWTPGADGYEKDGTPVSNNNRRAQEMYDRHAERTQSGDVYRVNPDGGIPHGEEHREMILEERRRQAARREDEKAARWREMRERWRK